MTYQKSIHPFAPFLNGFRIVPTPWRTDGPILVVGERGDCRIKAQRFDVFQKRSWIRGWARDCTRDRHSAGKRGDRGKLMVANDVSSDSDSHASFIWWQCSLRLSTD